MDMSELPDLVLHHIVAFLSTTDLLRCSMVNSRWRETFNHDLYWKKTCLTRHSINFYECLNERSSQVEPTFDELYVEDSTLQDPCEWKVNFMRAKHLEENREKGRYIIREVNGPGHEFWYQEEYIVGGSNGDVVYVLVDDNIELWNVSGEPFQIVKFKLPYSMLHYASWDEERVHLVEFIMNQEKIIIVQACILHVYTLSVDGYILQYRRIINRPEMDSHTIPDDEHINDWYNDNDVGDGILLLQCGIFKNLLYGVYNDCNTWSNNLFVWNLETGRVENIIGLVRDNNFFSDNDCDVVNLNSHSEHVFVTLNYYDDINHPLGYNTFKYNLLSGEFKSRSIAGHGKQSRVINKNLHLIGDMEKVQLYDFSTEDPTLLRSIDYTNLYNSMILTCFHEPYLAICVHKKNTYLISVLDTHSETLETLSSFDISTDDFIISQNIKSLPYETVIIHDDILILFCDFIDIWNWRKKIKLYSLPVNDYCPIFYKNEHFTQLYIRPDNCTKLCVFNFW